MRAYCSISPSKRTLGLGDMGETGMERRMRMRIRTRMTIRMRKRICDLEERMKKERERRGGGACRLHSRRLDRNDKVKAEESRVCILRDLRNQMTGLYMYILYDRLCVSSIIDH